MERGQDQEPNPPCMMLEEDLLWDDEEFISLSTKESPNPLHESLGVDLVVEGVRAEAAEWILGAQSHHGFSVATAVLAVNYLDRFLWCFRRDTDKPWMGQLAAVSCLSLAAKVEETRVPLLLDLQFEETRFLFEAKTIQKMELLVLSALEWKMNPVTPVPFLQYFAGRLGLKDSLRWEFLRRTELVLLSLISDSRSMSYLPSVMATAIMLHVVNSGNPCLEVEDQSLLLDIIDSEKKQNFLLQDEVDACRELVSEHALQIEQLRKPNLGIGSVPGSPDEVLEM